MENFNSKVWEQEIYGQGQHLNRYPFDNVVSFIYRNYPRDKQRADIKILEIGCGAGNNCWFAAREGFNVTGIDGSVSAINFANERFANEGLKGNFIVGDFTSLPFNDTEFDIVFDRGSIVCCNLAGGKQAINEAGRVLKTNGLFFFNPYSQAHSSFASGQLQADGRDRPVITPAMIEAGLYAFCEFDPDGSGPSSAETVASIFFYIRPMVGSKPNMWFMF